MSKSRISALLFLLVATFARAEEIQDFTTLSAAPASGDLWIVVDVSDTTDDAAGTAKIITTTNLFAYTGAFGGNAASATTSSGLNSTALAVANSWTAAQTFSLEDAGTTTTLYPLKVQRTTSGTAAAGLGSGLQFYLEDGSGNVDATNKIETVAVDVTHASEDADTIFYTMTAGSLVEAFRIRGSRMLLPAGTASLPAIGFLADDDGTGTGWIRSSTNGVCLTTNGSCKITTLDTGSTTFVASINGSGTASLTGWVAAVNPQTGTYGPVANNSLNLYTNAGDTDGSQLNLPNDPTAGTCFDVALTVAQAVNIVPASGETLYMGADQCANVTTGMSASAIGATTRVCATVGGSGGKWMAFGASGWTCND